MAHIELAAPAAAGLSSWRAARPSAARNFRILRQRGVTVRKAIDTVIATRCVEDGYELPHNDRDFDPFVKYLGLRAVAG
jgi:predicted nucleic acid-binding protein